MVGRHSQFSFPGILVVLLVCWGDAATGYTQSNKERLPGTQWLDWDEPIDVRMRRQADAFIERKIAAAVRTQSQLWHRDFSTPAAYDASVQPNRQHLRTILGAVRSSPRWHTHRAWDRPQAAIRMERIGDDDVPAVLYDGDDFRITRVRWPVFDGVCGEGLLLEPHGSFTASVVLVPDADQHPEQLVGLLDGIPRAHQIPRHLAASGVRVLIPTLINRQDVTPDGRLGQSNREWIYRQAFHMGRHIVGYEINKLEAALDWFAQTNRDDRPLGLAGWGEGALLALYTSALDTRVDVTLISGDWDMRDASWCEPIYRNIWSLMKEFDDADIASLIAPRTLIVEHHPFPAIDQSRDKAKYKQASDDRDQVARVTDAAAMLDKLRAGAPTETASADNVGTVKNAANWNSWMHAIPSTQSEDFAYGIQTQVAFAKALGAERHAASAPKTNAPGTSLNEFVVRRHQRQLAELDDYTQRLVRDSESVREDFYRNQALPVLAQRKWSTQASHPTTPVAEFTQHSSRYRQIFATEILGTFDEPLLPPNPLSRLLQQTPQWRADEVVLDVAQDLFAWGILMQPSDIQPGETRPVVVVQHGRNGVPRQIMDGGYNGIAEKLLARGYIVFAPHNLYRGEDEYRWLDRKANAIGKTLFSFLLLQHDQITQWLASLPQVDGDRIAFYGNSYGGESAVRIPTVLTRYALSICASDFNDWTRKVADTHDAHSFMNTNEWEMPYFNMGPTFSYAEMAYLMVPRPFMVERGHHDLVAPDHWVAAEYAKVRLVYDQLGIGDRTAITFFQGGHTMRGEQTLQFLDQHLRSGAESK